MREHAVKTNDSPLKIIKQHSLNLALVIKRM